MNIKYMLQTCGIHSNIISENEEPCFVHKLNIYNVSKLKIRIYPLQINILESKKKLKIVTIM